MEGQWQSWTQNLKSQIIRNPDYCPGDVSHLYIQLFQVNKDQSDTEDSSYESSEEESDVQITSDRMSRKGSY